MGYIGRLSWKRDKPYVAVSLLPASIYAFGYAFEILCTNIEWIKFWVKVEYLGGAFLGVLWLMFALNFTGYIEKIKNITLMLLYIMPVIILIVNYTNDFHHLFYKKMYINNDGIFPILEVIHGPWYWVHIVYNYVLMAIGLIIFIKAYLRAVTIIRKQILLLIIAWIIPWISNIIYIFGLLHFDVDLVPLTISISAIMYSFAVLKFKFLKLTPIALEKVFSNMLDGVIILDSKNNIINFNNSSKSIISELKDIKAGGKKIDEVLKKYKALLEVVNSTSNNESLISVKDKDKLRYYKINISNIYENTDKIIGKIIILNDITEIELQREKLSELNAFKDRLFTIVSHDIKSPLGVLLSLLDLLEDEDDIYKEENKEILYQIKENSKNTYEMIENVLQWCRSQMDGMTCNNLSWTLLDIVKNSITPLIQNAELKKIKVSYEISEEIVVCVDRDMLEIVLRNLFSNAIKFTNSGGNIKISAQEFEGMVNVAVSDNGVGMEEEKVEKLFSNFNHHTTLGTSGEKGTGIGLMVCKKLIEKNNGKIWARSSVGKGSTFGFTILSGKSA
ncbi:sensor histidine kinase [Clostridium autoethanogenum]|uniref:histidine kinase n=1 Tax=Clostridium autoethanogenum DSM 10061 TaxID=1341692 RepID=A0ABN4BJ39_9CLOT|nr:histidine kinase N-terminal 7TM domain-containing protein [Clostridium autoethanogenum]AGY77778.1 ATP-binding protein [Clostridium autoethanogenum DSM 10061]ALU37913.1 Histidine kinase-like ATPase [Clostridium autoethanogenum DSM 10061]OVY49736.1 Alginate biosynthesis sensor protein KinB [Clostridium autoethanogenum]